MRVPKQRRWLERLGPHQTQSLDSLSAPAAPPLSPNSTRHAKTTVEGDLYDAFADTARPTSDASVYHLCPL